MSEERELYCIRCLAGALPFAISDNLSGKYNTIETHQLTMGKRAKKAQIQTKKRQTLAKQFKCPICTNGKSIDFIIPCGVLFVCLFRMMYHVMILFPLLSMSI